MPSSLERFFAETLAIKELRGSEGYVEILQQELAREGVIARFAAEKRAALTAASAAQQSSEQLDIASKALEFYAEGQNHKARNGELSAVAKDKGRRARRALEAIAGETDQGDGDGDDD